MANMGRCDQEIYENGEFVGILVNVQGAENIEREVQRVAQLGFRVDWHYVAGRGVIKTLSDVDRVRAAFVANRHTLWRGD